MSTATVINGDARRLPLADGSVHMVCTSPPYWNLRDYGTATWEGGADGCDHLGPIKSVTSGLEAFSERYDGINRGEHLPCREGVRTPYRDTCGKCGARRVDRQIGLEESPDAYVAAMVRVFREVRRVLRDDGTCWLNLGDSYTGTGNSGGKTEGVRLNGQGTGKAGAQHRKDGLPTKPGKPKDLIGIPWRTALALQQDGWYLRDAIIWSKAEVDDDDVLEGSAMPGSQRDRCTSAYEFVFQFAKAERYYFDAEAIKSKSGAMPRNVWRINPSPWKGAHFATFPPALVERCVKAGCPIGGTVIDPFAGSGTTGVVATGLGRRFVGVELSPDYCRMAVRRISRPHARHRTGRREDHPLFVGVAE